MAEHKTAWIAAISTMFVALVGGGVTIFTTMYSKDPPDEPPTVAVDGGSETANKRGEDKGGDEGEAPETGKVEDPIEKLRRMNEPLKTVAETDDRIAARLSVRAPVDTLLHLELFRGDKLVGQIVGRVTEPNVGPVAVLPRIPGVTGVRGEIITSSRKTVTVDVNEPSGADLEDVYDMDLEIAADGSLQIVHAVACPWVYVFDGKQWHQRVEIIQNLVGKEREKTQSVHLGTVTPVSDGEVTIQIHEELDEISYIDRLSLNFAGRERLIPPASASQGLDRLGAVDEDYLVLHKGEMVEITFRDEGFRAGEAESLIISAAGYYDPASRP